MSQRQDLSGLYSREEIIYTLIQLSESGYIDMKYSADNDRLSISMGNILYVTPKGHEFVANLKDKDRWNEKIKPIASSLGTISLAIIESIASGVTSAAIEKLMIGQ